MLKKFVALVLICALMALGACSAPPRPAPEPEDLDPKKTLTICFDLDSSWDPRHCEFSRETSVTYTGGKLRRQAVEGFIRDLKEAGGPENVEVEFIEGYTSDREGQLTRLRAELMAGEGPDLFVARNSGTTDLFLFPEKKMEDGIFLALDKYMDRAQFMEPDKMIAPVFDAGKSKDGRRFLLPMTYSISAAALRSSQLDFDPYEPRPVSDLLEGEGSLSGVLSFWVEEETGAMWGIYQAMGQLADYEKEAPAFTKEELSGFFAELLEYGQRLEGGELTVPDGIHMENPADLDSKLAKLGWAREPAALMPMPDRDGGVTARVGFFMGVNANSKNPAGAFCAADFLLGHDYMRDSDLHMYMRNSTNPIYADLMGPGQELPYVRSGPAELFDSISGEHWEDFQKMTGMITGAEFPTRLDGLLDQAYHDYCLAEDGAARDKVVDEAYSQARMLLGEA